MHVNELPETIDSITYDAVGLGKLRGFLFDGSICQFNNIPYGEVPGRWMSALPVKTPWDQKEVRDAQTHGYDNYMNILQKPNFSSFGTDLCTAPIAHNPLDDSTQSL